MNRQARTEMIFNTEEEIQKAKETALVLSKDYAPDIKTLLFSDKLSEVENGIKKLNEISDKCWLLSAIAMYTAIYNKNLYLQSGLEWTDYMKESRERLGLDKRDVSEQLSSARFFVTNYEKLVAKNWTPLHSAQKLARAELALELSEDIDAVIDHLVNDTWKEFKAWYQSFYKPAPAIPVIRDDIQIVGGTVLVNGVEAVTLSDKLSEQDKTKVKSYLEQIFTCMKNGVEPVIGM